MKRILGIGCLGILVLAIGLVAVAVAVGSRSGSTPSTVAQASPAPPALVVGTIGQRVESAGITLTVNSVSRADALNSIQRAKPERTYVVADLTLGSTTRDKAPYNPAYFKVKDASGYEYSAQLAGTDTYLKSGELAAGETVRGVVAFDVPSSATGLVLSYQPAVIFGGYQVIRVALN